MSITLRVLLCYFVASLAAFASGEGSERSFQAGIEAYEKGDYESAITQFNDALEIDETAAARHNLGLAYFQVDQPAEAIWQLERALLLAPFNENYRERLNAIRRELGLLPADLSWYTMASQLLTPRAWMVSAVASFWLFLTAWVLLRIGGFNKGLRIQIVRAISLLVFALALSALWLNLRMHRFGTVLSGKNTSLHAAPATAAPESGFARPGERARVLDRYNDFYEIETDGLATGWISKDQFRPLVD